MEILFASEFWYFLTLLSMIDSLNKQKEALRLLEIDMNLVTKKVKEGRL